MRNEPPPRYVDPRIRLSAPANRAIVRERVA